MNQPDPWPRVHALLDARRDPLADPALQAWLLADAAALQQVITLRAALACLPRRRTRRRVAAAAAILVLAAGMGWLASGATPAGPAPLPMPTLAGGDFVRAFSASVELRGDEATVTVTATDRVLVQERHTRWVSPAAEGSVVREVCLLEANLR